MWVKLSPVGEGERWRKSHTGQTRAYRRLDRRGDVMPWVLSL
jgi:hypothetical protein